MRFPILHFNSLLRFLIFRSYLSFLLLNYDNYIHFIIHIFDMSQNLLFIFFIYYNFYCTTWRSMWNLYWSMPINSNYFRTFNMNPIFINISCIIHSNKSILLICIQIYQGMTDARAPGACALGSKFLRGSTFFLISSKFLLCK